MELERKYNKGAKIVLFISVMAIPMQLVTSALISRVSPEASGTLGVLEIFYNAIISFFMLGGETGIVKLLTNQKGITSKKNFIIKYIFLCVIFFVITTTILRLFNIDIIKVITGREAQTSILMYAVAIFIIINNIDQIPNLFKSIIFEAFNFKALGFGVLSSFIVGIQRGIFSNEAGLGTGAIAASTVKTKFPTNQGYVQILGIYITTFLVCTATSLVILTSDINFLGNNLNGIEMTQNAFIYHLGNIGNIIVIISIILFAFSTILSGFYDAESNLKYLTNKTDYLKIVICVVLFVSSIIPAKTIWEIVNILTAILAIINIYAIIKLKKDVIFELRRYKECGKMN